jgi:hypothetical protein
MQIKKIVCNLFLLPIYRLLLNSLGGREELEDNTYVIR